MARLLSLSITAMLLMTALVSAGDLSLAIIQNTPNNQLLLDGYPGMAWGKTGVKIYLNCNQSQIGWLENAGIDFRSVPFEGEPSALYLCYGQRLSGEGALDQGDGYVLSQSKIDGAQMCRELILRRLPFGVPGNLRTDVNDYQPIIDNIIGQVSEDSLMDFLSRLSGEIPIEIDGHPDTILTRYSGTEGNELAARYIKQTLEGYGYDAEYHSYFGGQLRNVAAYGDNLAWMVDEGGEAYRTTDGGATWQIMNTNSLQALWGVANIGADSVWVTGNLGIVRFSSDGGETFVTQNAESSSYLFGCFFVNSMEGWIAGDYGSIRHTSNAGQDWTLQTTPTGSRLYDVYFVDVDYGWAVGRDGTIIHTIDGGLTWTAQQANTSDRLYGVKFINRSTGWVVGWSGVVRFTTDGGDTWQIITLGDNLEKYQVDFSDADHGCIVGWGGGVYITSNGGQDWTTVGTNSGKNFYGLAFADNLTGYAVGDGAIWKTTDGGHSWFDQASGVEGAWSNVIGTKPGRVDPDEQVIICGHFDNTSEMHDIRATGADDNGSGTMAVLEAARLFRDVNFDKTIKLCLWTGEEQGLTGSAAYAEDAFARGDDIVGVYNFDMIAYDGNDDFLGELHCGTMTSSIDLGDLFEAAISDYAIGLDTRLLTFGSTDRSDHASFWEYNYPAILGIEDFSYDFNPYYHTTQDNMSHIDAPFFTEYVKAAIAATATLAVPDTTVGIDEPENLPEDYILISNYPNPFNATTKISLELPERSDVSLVVYDLLGRKISEIYAGDLDAGHHDFIWNGDNCASGLYFYSLKTDERTTTGRMTLLK